MTADLATKLRKMASENPLLLDDERATIREAADEIERLRCPKIEKPTQPGPHWFRWFGDGPWHVLRIARGAKPSEPEIGVIEADRYVMPLDIYKGEWRGPIPEPISSDAAPPPPADSACQTTEAAQEIQAKETE